jgi:hypothetical protein
VLVGDKPLLLAGVGWHTVVCYGDLERFRLLSAPGTVASNFSNLYLIWSLADRSHGIAEPKGIDFEGVDSVLCPVAMQRSSLNWGLGRQHIPSKSKEATIPSSVTIW